MRTIAVVNILFGAVVLPLALLDNGPTFVAVIAAFDLAAGIALLVAVYIGWIDT